MKKMDCETDFVKELECFRKKCLELEEMCKKNEIRCLMLETEVGNLRKKNQELEGKIELIQKGIVEKESAIHDVMAENTVLECEKQKAEKDLCFWKKKVKEEINVVSKGTKEEALHSKFIQWLSIDDDECPDKKMCPTTPGVGKSPFHGIIDVSNEDVSVQSPVHGIIAISDDNVDYKEIPKVKKSYSSRNCDDSANSRRHSSKNNIQKTNLEQHTDEEHMDEFKFHSSNTRRAKRKRAVKILTSDDESSYDDNAPICTVKKQHIPRVMTDSEEEVTENASGRRLKRLRRLESKNKQDDSIFDLTKDDNVYSDDGVDELESEGESLDGFIVDSSESMSKSCNSECGDSIDESEDALSECKETLDKIESEDASLSDYKETLDKIARKKKKSSNLKWDLEGDMLADFGKNPILCMRAVCALYRQQTDDEKELKATLHHNERGFSQPDAPGGTALAQFLLDGYPDGDVVKTEEDLKEFDPEGLERCMSLAAKYSKQLFEIYQNSEDPYLKPE